MKASEIIIADTERHGVDPEEVLHMIKKDMDTGRFILITSHNSVFLVEMMPNNMADVHLFTVDSPLALMAAIAEFVDEMRQAGIKAIHGMAENMQILKLLEKTGAHVQLVDHPDYNFIADL